MEQKIMIVDDEENVRRMVAEAFSGVYTVITTADGAEAVKLIESERPALVFLDIRMPGLSGLEVLKTVKEKGSGAIIWMLTGEEDLETASTALQLGAAGYLTKPFEVARLRQIAASAIESVTEEGKNLAAQADKPWRVEKK